MSSASSAPPSVAAGDVPRIAVSDLTIAYGSSVIQRDLDASFAQLQWVVDAYALTLATTVLAAGSLADLFGRRLVFTIGLVIFSGSKSMRMPRGGRLLMIVKMIPRAWSFATVA